MAVLNRQRAKIQQLFDEYYSGFDAAFDEHSAYASAERWFDRTAKLIEDNIGGAEAKKFKRALSSAPKGRGGWRWREYCQYFDTYLHRLTDDIEENPDDPGFDEVTEKATPAHPPKKPAGIGHDVFLSYSTQDKDEAREIYDAVQRVGRRCFLSEKSLRPGDNFNEEIRSALEHAHEVWILVSPGSIQSTWVQREVAAAWALKKRIVPILLRCAPDDLPEILAASQAIDFHRVHAFIANLRQS